MESTPAISVIMSVYNEPYEWLDASIDSILSQTYTNFEFIIIDDNPQDQALYHHLLLYQKRDERVRLIINENNLGLPKSLNKGIAHAEGCYIARMDADDIAYPKRLQVQYAYMEAHPDTAVCGTWARLFGDISLLSYRQLKSPVSFEQILLFSLFNSPMVHPSVMARSEVMKGNPYDEKCLKAQDYELWCRLLTREYRFYNIPRYLMKYRMTKKSMTNSVLSKQKAVAGKMRQRMFDYLGLDQRDLTLHGVIEYQNERCDIDAAEQYLIGLREKLVSLFPEERSYIQNIIQTKWAYTCIRNGKSYYRYRSSELYRYYSVLTLLRFIKYTLIRFLS